MRKERTREKELEGRMGKGRMRSGEKKSQASLEGWNGDCARPLDF